MPSDERVRVALGALERPIAEFRSTVEGALAQAEAHLATLENDPAARLARIRDELGVFAQGRLDAGAFASLFVQPAPRLLEHQERFRAAVATMREVLGQGDALFVASVPPGTAVTRAVEDALSRIGRAFGAVLAVELMRGGAYRPEEHDQLLDHLSFRSWTRTERRYAPPLVVEVNGPDLQVGGLSDFTDGRERIVLVVQGECPPAPLVRLITPGTMVLQTVDGSGLEQLALHDGPGIAAMVPETAARFLHDPRAGREPWQRLSVWHLPEPPRRSIGGFSPWQMAEDLRQLRALAAAPAEAPLPAMAGGAPQGPEAVDRLASWLLGQSDLKGIA
jgi:hypothetical protein